MNFFVERRKEREKERKSHQVPHWYRGLEICYLKCEIEKKGRGSGSVLPNQSH
jgi:hypothetical protein